MSSRQLRKSLKENHRSLLSGRASSEEDVVAQLVSPMLVHLDYTPETIRHQHHIGRKKADIALWPSKDAMRRLPPSIIVEVKKLDAEFDSGPSLTNTPRRQIEGYMISDESGGGVLGALTDGVRWRLLRRTGSTSIEALGEWNVLDDSTAINKIKKLIGRSSAITQAPADSATAKAKPWKTALDMLSHDNIDLPMLFNALDLRGEVQTDVNTAGDAQSTLAKMQEDWCRIAWTRGPRLKTEQPELKLNPHDEEKASAVIVGYAEVKSIARDDVHLLLRTLARQTPGGAAACIVSRRTDGGTTVRIGVHRGGRTSIGEPFDAEVPNDKAATVMNRLFHLTSQTEVVEQRIENVVSNIDVHKEFFNQIRAWVARQMKGKDPQERSAVLRHLLRCVFIWSVKDRIGVPEIFFESLWWRRIGHGSYHEEVVRFLFHNRLNKRQNHSIHHNGDVQQALSSVRYLNGSLFAEQRGDRKLAIRDEDYFGHKAGHEGLWTIFAGHNWTTQEEDAEIREQSVDPKMLGGLFENLIAAIETGSTANLLERMPDGTYYTPVDVVWEMAKDALTERLLESDLPRGWSRSAVAALFADGDLPKGGRDKMAKELAGLTVFDPAVGSGEFLLGITRAIGRGLAKLDAPPELARTRRIIEEQIHGQDINALAASVARLRLFIAIEDDEAPLDEEQPLPNLEAKIVCADSIGTEIRRKQPVSFAAVDPDISAALRKCHEIQDQFMLAHGRRKDKMRESRRKAGQKLKAALRRVGETHGSLEAFADHDYLNHDNDVPVQTDPRWTFGLRAAHGFDVVIGNPPYVRLAKIETRVRDKLRKDAKRNGYGSFDDLFMPFCEAGLELVKPCQGVICFVVPLSLSFAAAKSSLRDAYIGDCSRIAVRHQDNRPDTTFGHSPVEHEENRQRTTIVLGVRGDAKCKLLTGGLGRWAKSQRHSYLRRRSHVEWSERIISKKLPSECKGQWPRISTKEGARILRELIGRGGPAVWQGSAAIGLPKTAMYFVTASPAGMFDRRESLLACTDSQMDARLAILNSGTAYLWWKAWGDGFDVKAATFRAFPDLRLLVNVRDLRRLGAELREEMEHGQRRKSQSGTGGGRLTENLNLWQNAGEVLNRVDALILNGLGLEGERYKGALVIERSRSIPK